jgi:ATP-dependent Clp protease protease subunit
MANKNVFCNTPWYEATEIPKMKKTLTEIYVDHNSKGKIFDQLNIGMECDKFMSAEESVEYGLVDELITRR